MQLKKQYQRYATPEAQKALADRIGLHWYEEMQDWDLIMSDPDRISEYLKVYKSDTLNDDQKFALMELIISSFDDLSGVESLEGNHLWLECNIILKAECWLHVSTIHYWSALESEKGFPISKYIRVVWEEIKENFF